MINFNDHFEWALQRVIASAEEKRLDPPQDRFIKCHYCGGKGYFPGTPDRPDRVDCDVCEGHGEMAEPAEWEGR